MATSDSWMKVSPDSLAVCARGYLETLSEHAHHRLCAGHVRHLACRHEPTETCVAGSCSPLAERRLRSRAEAAVPSLRMNDPLSGAIEGHDLYPKADDVGGDADD